jgi:hypothetical protein
MDAVAILIWALFFVGVEGVSDALAGDAVPDEAVVVEATGLEEVIFEQEAKETATSPITNNDFNESFIELLLLFLYIIYDIL